MDKSTATLTPTFAGKLYIVATPIGNINDISPRAIETLKSVDAILAEDTRHSGILLKRLDIQKPLFSLHAHNEHEKTNTLITAMQQGQSFALISDAGTPLIRDPGFSLVREARRVSLQVIPIPGPCALITAISAAGVPCDSFTFAGFLPIKRGARIDALNRLRAQGHTVIFYESTHRIMACLDDIKASYSSEYQLLLVKELTKIHEAFIQGTTHEIQHWLNAEGGRIKGEFVFILPAVHETSSNEEDERLLKVLLAELPLKQAVKVATKLTSTNKNVLYSLAIKITS